MTFVVDPAALTATNGARKSCGEGALRAFRSSSTRGGRGSTYSLTALWICTTRMTSVNLSPDVGLVNAGGNVGRMRKKQGNSGVSRDCVPSSEGRAPPNARDREVLR